MSEQFSLFGAAAAEPSIDDLDGVMLAGGHWVRQGTVRPSTVRQGSGRQGSDRQSSGDQGGAARLSVVVVQQWRADALAAEFALRDLAAADPIVRAEDGWSVRTPFTEQLTAGANRWSRGANEGPPPGFTLSPGGLRLWAIAAGERDEAGYLLATDRADSDLHLAAGAQLSRRGLAAVSLSRRGGPGWRVTSTKRIRRLAELLGPAPPGGADHWPGWVG